jgi:hypothetical protein
MARRGEALIVISRVISDCCFRKTTTVYDRKPGIRWLSCTAKWQSDITLRLIQARPNWCAYEPGPHQFVLGAAGTGAHRRGPRSQFQGALSVL